jgi:hypothetical protein
MLMKMGVVLKYYGQPPGYVANIAGTVFPINGPPSYAHNFGSELAEPQKLIPNLLQADIKKLAPDIIAVYIQAAAKIFGYWSAELAGRWDDDDLPQVKGMVDVIITRISEFVASPHIEVQERVSKTYCPILADPSSLSATVQ